MNKENETSHEMLLKKGFKGLRPNRDINIAAIVADEYASQQTAQKDAEIAELKAKADNIMEASQNLNTSIDIEWNKPVWLRFKETGIKKICLYQK